MACCERALRTSVFSAPDLEVRRPADDVAGGEAADLEPARGPDHGAARRRRPGWPGVRPAGRGARSWRRATARCRSR